MGLNENEIELKVYCIYVEDNTTFGVGDIYMTLKISLKKLILGPNSEQHLGSYNSVKV